MAIPKIQFISESLNEVHFTLSNKPQYLCKMDLDKYNEFIRDSKSYRVKEESKYRGAYICRSIGSGTHFLHWDLMGEKLDINSGFVTDHINRDKLDNRMKNLRKTTPAINSRNKDSCTQNLAGELNVPKGYRIGRKFQNGKIHYQAYFHIGKIKTYIKCSKSKEVIKKAVMDHHNQRIENV